MATVTPNYNWPVPTSTDFVKDGAASIEALGDAIDATVFGLPTGALTLIATASPSAVSSQSFDDVFSATYQNYVIYTALTYTNAISAHFRMRVGGVDASSGVYSNQLLQATSTTVSANRSVSATTGTLTGTTAGDPIFKVLDVSNPFAAANTQISITGFYDGPIIDIRAAQHNAATSYDGITFIASAGTFTGDIRIYGVQN
jgi:hypothetical protein